MAPTTHRQNDVAIVASAAQAHEYTSALISIVHNGCEGASAEERNHASLNPFKHEHMLAGTLLDPDLTYAYHDRALTGSTLISQ